MSKRGSLTFWLCSLWWSISNAVALCPNNYVSNPSASSNAIWTIQPPDTNTNGASLASGSFRIQTTGLERTQKGYFSQTINVLFGASNFTISARMKRDMAAFEGSPYLVMDVLNQQGTTINTLADAKLVGITSSWETYSASFYLPAGSTQMVIKLAVQPAQLNVKSSANVAYFDDICVTYAKLASSVQSVTAVTGKQASLKCVLVGADTATFVWTTTTGALDTSRPVFVLSTGSVSSLNFGSAALSDEGSYTCHATTPAGNTSATGNFLVHTPPYFLNSPSPKTVRLGDDLVLPCDVDGRPSPTVKWYKGKTLIAGVTYSYISINVQSHELTIRAVDAMRDTGVYVCYALNDVGNVTRVYNLTLSSSGGSEVVNPVIPGVTGQPMVLPTTNGVHLQGSHTDYPTPSSHGAHPSDGKAEETSFWDKEVLGLYVYIWIAIGGVALIVFILILACCVALCRRRSRRKRLERQRNTPSVQYNKGSRRAGYVVSDTARIVGPGPHMRAHPNPYYPDGTLDSGYNSNRESTWMQGNGYPGYDMRCAPGTGYRPGHGGMMGNPVPVGHRQSQGSFPRETRQLVPRIPTEDELEGMEGHDNPNFYEELGMVQRETIEYLDMSEDLSPKPQKDEYLVMKPGATPGVSLPVAHTSLDRGNRPQFSSMDESRSDLRPRLATPDSRSRLAAPNAPPPLPVRPTHMAAEDEAPKRLSVSNSQAESEKRRSIEADVPDTPGDVDYRL